MSSSPCDVITVKTRARMDGCLLTGGSRTLDSREPPCVCVCVCQRLLVAVSESRKVEVGC